MQENQILTIDVDIFFLKQITIITSLSKHKKVIMFF